MCGICGITPIDPARHPERETLERMNAAIIDVEGGSQPLSNEDNTIWIVFNREIYNAPELRRNLMARRHRFSTRTDTECIVHLYEDHGADCVHALRGMFVIAILDRRSRSVFLARDRLGKKPLYYSSTSHALVFGSELKCLVRHPAVRTELDPQAIHHYLTLQAVPDPLTIYRSARKLPPAHRLSGAEGNSHWSATGRHASSRNGTARKTSCAPGSGRSLKTPGASGCRVTCRLVRISAAGSIRRLSPP